MNDSGQGTRDLSEDDETLRRDLIESYTAARDDIDEAMSGLPPETPCGGWTVIEIAAHIAAWEKYSSEQMASLAVGLPESAVNVDALNEAAAIAARSAPPGKTLALYATERKSFIDRLEGLPSAAFRLDAVRGHVAMEIGHCAEHAAELRTLKAVSGGGQ